MWPFTRHHHRAITALWQEIGPLNRHFSSLHHHLKAIAMNQQEELDALSTLDDKLTSVEQGVAGLQAKIVELTDAMSSQGSFIPQPVADALAKVKAHADRLAATFGTTTTDSPAVTGDGTPLVDTTPTTPPAGTPVGAQTVAPAGKSKTVF